MSGEPLEHRYRHQDDYEDSYPEHWPETRRRIENSLEFAHHFNEMVERNDPSQKILGFCAQQAVENALKGWLSAYNDLRNWGHEFGSLWEGIQEKEDFSRPELHDLHEKVTDLLEATSYVDSQDFTAKVNWLEKYAVVSIDHGPQNPMTHTERLELREKANEVLSAITDRIMDISSATADDLFPDGRPW